MWDLNRRANPIHYLIDTEALLRDMEEGRTRERQKRHREREWREANESYRDT